MKRPLIEAIARSRSSDSTMRMRAIETLADHITDPGALWRLGEMLDDHNIAVESAAAAVLLNQAGAEGLALVLDELVRRDGDADLDYVSLIVLEVKSTARPTLFEEAKSIAIRRNSDVMVEVVDDLIATHNRNQQYR
ncbi:hypothetical protein ACNHUS_18915 [Actinomycetes bacterium M1A6_2h]